VADSDPRDTVPSRRGLNPRRSGQLLIGRLKDHGPANYQFRAKEDPSYYVKVLTSRGERVLWGKDLQRALTEGETRPNTGDLIGARRVAREAVTVTSRHRDREGRVIALEERHAHRTRWVVEKVAFFAERARMARRLRDEQADVRESVRAHPELKSTFLSVRAAEEFAAKRIANPQDRERFLELVRGAMSTSIRKGEPLPSTSLRDRPSERTASPSTRNPKREDPTR
jgi:hypothetical protein